MFQTKLQGIIEAMQLALDRKNDSFNIYSVKYGSTKQSIPQKLRGTGSD